MRAPTNPGRVVHLGAGHVRVRDLCGSDERALTGTTTHDACALLDRLLVDDSSALACGGEASSLTVAERDRLLADVYAHTFGDRISGTATCAQCQERYDLDFALSDLTADPPARIATLANGMRLRAPTGDDELALAQVDPSEAATVLLARCIVEGDLDAIDPEEAAKALQEVAPVLDLDAHAPCPDCGHGNTVHFSVQAYLLGALLQERRRLMAEIHLLARGYGWSLEEISTLTREDRRTLVAFVEDGVGHT